MEVNDNTVTQTLKDNKVVLLDFWAEWCGPCRVLGPTIEELETDFEGKAFVGNLDFSELNHIYNYTEIRNSWQGVLGLDTPFTDNPNTSSKYSVRSIPTVIIYKNGKEVERLVGVRDKTFYKDKINYYLN